MTREAVHPEAQLVGGTWPWQGRRMIRSLVSLSLIVSALANDTAMHDGGSGPEPVGWPEGRESVIRMVREEISVEMGPFESSVHCRFVFVSGKKNAPAVQFVGFPDITRGPHEGDTVGPLRGMRTFVDGREVESELVSKRLAEDGSWLDLGQAEADRLREAGAFDFQTWHVVKVSFPPGEEVVIERRFRTDNALTAGGPVFFSYTTRTGGNWRGTIGSGKFTVRVAEGMQAAKWSLQPAEAGWKRSDDGRTFTLEWKDFEPRTDEARTGWSLGWFPASGEMPDYEKVRKRLSGAYGG